MGAADGMGSLQLPEDNSDNETKDDNDNKSLLSVHSKKSIDFGRQGSNVSSNHGGGGGNSVLHYKNHAVYGGGTFDDPKEEMSAIQSKRV